MAVLAVDDQSAKTDLLTPSSSCIKKQIKRLCMCVVCSHNTNLCNNSGKKEVLKENALTIKFRGKEVPL